MGVSKIVVNVDLQGMKSAPQSVYIQMHISTKQLRIFIHKRKCFIEHHSHCHSSTIDLEEKRELQNTFDLYLLDFIIIKFEIKNVL